MEFEGTVWSVLPVVKGTSARGEWVKQEVVFEQPGEFSRKVCVSFWGDRAQEAGALQKGETVSVSANVESREYNGRWFTEVRRLRLRTDCRRWTLSRPKTRRPRPVRPKWTICRSDRIVSRNTRGRLLFRIGNVLRAVRTARRTFFYAFSARFAVRG